MRLGGMTRVSFALAELLRNSVSHLCVKGPGPFCFFLMLFTLSHYSLGAGDNEGTCAPLLWRGSSCSEYA